MKICPQCRKEYDDTWGVCIKCNVPLENADTPGGATPEQIAAIREELQNVRSEVSKLNERLNLIDYSLSPAKDKTFAHKYESLWKEPSPGPAKPQKQPEPVFAKFKEDVRDIVREPKKSMAENFEQVLGGKWFNKLGILAVVIGVALLIGYSFRYLGPVGKIAIGYAFGLGMIIFGRLIERKQDFSMYGKGLLGGGWAIAYFTTFAMHHIPAVRLVASPIAGMLLLLAVSAVAVADIYRYKSQAATGFSYLLIFLTLMISPLSFYTMAAMVPVTLSLSFFMYKMKWPVFGIYGMVMTYVTFMGWFGIAQKSGMPPMTREQFFAAWAFLLLYWAIFAITTLIIKDEGRKKDGNITGLVRVGYREISHILNTLIASFNGWMLISAGFSEYVKPALILGAGLYLALTVITYIMKDRPIYIISSTFAIIYAAIHLALTFSGYKLTVSYLILAEIILFAGIILKESYWRLFSFASLAAILAKLLIIDSFVVQNSPMAGHLSTRTMLFAFAFMVYLVNHFLYKRLQEKEMLTDAEEGHACIISYGYPLIYAMGTWLDLPKVLTAPAWVILGVILLQVGVMKDNRHQRIQGYILTIGAFTRLLMSNMLVTGGISILSYRMITCVPVLLVLYYCVMLLQDEKTEAVLAGSEKKMVFVFSYMVFTIIMVLVWYEVSKALVAPVWGLIAVAYSLRGVFSKKDHYLSISSIAAVAAAMRGIFVNVVQSKYLVGAESPLIYSVATIAMLFSGNIFYLVSKSVKSGIAGSDEGGIKRFLHSSRLVYGFTATVLLTVLLAVKLTGVLLTVSLGIEGMLLLLAGFGLKDKEWRIFGLVILLMTLAKAFLVDLRQLSTLYYILSLIVLGIALLFVSYLYTKHKDKIKKLM